jgi:hypothetical protein
MQKEVNIVYTQMLKKIIFLSSLRKIYALCQLGESAKRDKKHENCPILANC